MKSVVNAEITSIIELIGRRLGKLDASVGNLNSLVPMAEYRG